MTNTHETQHPLEDSRGFSDDNLPLTEEDVNNYVRSGRGGRLESSEACRNWRRRLKGAGEARCALPLAEDLPLEYFDLCPRLRLMSEFFERTADDFVAHRYCDLRFLQFLETYPLVGREAGLEVSFFEPSCWMYFYACAAVDDQQLERSVERADGVNVPVGVKGHMSSEVRIEAGEIALAARSLQEFQAVDARVTEGKLSRYWATYRNTLELYLVRHHSRTVDQRIFDTLVYLGVSGSFFKFAERVNSSYIM